MNTIYKIKEDANLEILKELGYEVFNNNNSFLKLVTQPLDGEAPSFMIKYFYSNKEWINKVYKKNRTQMQKELGLYYDENGKIEFNEQFLSIITSWFIQIDLQDDGWVGFTSADKFDTNVFYGSKVLEKYCFHEIEMLKKYDLIEELKVEE